ncbi:uncharacterized protein LOC102805489 [Saccoglossus kowalevskii]|uniref:Uncharacterized protein LOC102805489 n=1 Tax=Saccoglossus kowalevskii TaxID=10224 RepID=A0ABM0MV47_SACKO|nr:PREDICTED: uncharacterized protein LOC102805489 [Saccoglossus kowalevskii]
MKAIWFGILHHVVNEHEWLLNVDGTYGGCAHEPLSVENQCKPWLEKGSPAHLALRNIVEDKRLLKNLGHYTNFRHTGFLESFHSHMLMYAPKRHSYTFVGYKARTQLAAIDFNMHAGREQAVSEDGQPKFKINYSKQSKRFYPSAVLVPKQYTYITELQELVFRMRSTVEGHLSQHISFAEDDPRRIHRRRSLMDPPSLSDLVSQHLSRFSRSSTSDCTTSNQTT